MRISIKKEGTKITPFSKEDYQKFCKLSYGIYQVDLKDFDTRTAK